MVYVVLCDIFIENNTLLLWGGKKVATSFLTALELASNQHITIKYKDSDYKQIIPGDINGDGKVNMKDVTRLHQYINGWDVPIF